MAAPVTPESRLGHMLDNHLELISILGVGAYGVVYTAIDVDTQKPYAIKALNKVGLDARQKKFQAREIALHARAQAHPSIVSLIEILDAPDCVYVVMEYCPEGDLFSVITEHGGYVGDDELARSVFLQMLDDVEYCHRLGIYHRDLKPENVLVCDGGRTVKLADFGLATTENFTADFGCGSTFYMSPECQASPPRRNQCYASGPNDIWSLGIMLVNLTCGRNPWKRASVSTDETFRAFVKNPDFLASILPLSDELNYILRRIFQLDPAKRISLSELRHLIVHCPSFTRQEEYEDEEQEEEMTLASEDEIMTSAEDDIAMVEATLARPQTPPPSVGHVSSRTSASCHAPATPCTPNSGRAGFYKTRHGNTAQPPPTPISPLHPNAAGRDGMSDVTVVAGQQYRLATQAHQRPGHQPYDSCSSISSHDSTSSCEQKEMLGRAPVIAGDFVFDSIVDPSAIAAAAAAAAVAGGRASTQFLSLPAQMHFGMPLDKQQQQLQQQQSAKVLAPIVPLSLHDGRHLLHNRF